MNIQHVDSRHFDQACARLAGFMFERAAAESKHWGISYIEADDGICPSSLRGIQAEMHHCLANCLPFPISNAGNDSSIYGHAANVAFRFWHDMIHFQHRLTTKLEDEIEASWIHAQAVGQRFGQGSLKQRIMRADVEGQARYYFENGNFVTDQRTFVLSQIMAGKY